MLRLFNSLSGRIEPFVPRSSPITMYVCGITPYDTTHLGHAFTYIVFDVLLRHLRRQDRSVRYVSNITDVDDSILRRARERGLDYRELGREQTAKFLKDMDQLNVTAPDVQPRASDEIEQMLDIIERLLERGMAYTADGWVYFDVAAFPRYGQLSRLSRDEMVRISASRGADPHDRRKRDPLDFVLWQPSLAGEPRWQAPWGEGRPGWHVECSAMVLHHLGETIDLHGGGSDLVFPHHESEIAQSEAFTSTRPFARFWLHVGMVRLNGEKMSKSLGNLILVQDLLHRHSADAIRLYLLSFHYRQGLDFDEQALAEFDRLAARLPPAVLAGREDSPDAAFSQALEDDLDTPSAIALLTNQVEAVERGTVGVAGALSAEARALGLTCAARPALA